MNAVETKELLISDQREIQGTWQVIYSEDSGRIAPQELLKNLRIIIDEETLTSEIAGQKSVQSTRLILRVNLSRSILPKTDARNGASTIWKATH